MKCLLIFLCFFVNVIHGDDTPKHLSFHQMKAMEDYLPKDAAIQLLQRQLSDFQNKSVQIRGFLYQTSQNAWVLSSEPNLKSCCVGNVKKIAHQMIVLGDIPKNLQGRSVTVTGIFSINPNWNDQGELTQLYTISQATVVSDAGWPWTSLAFASGGILCCIILGTLLRHKPPMQSADE